MVITEVIDYSLVRERIQSANQKLTCVHTYAWLKCIFRFLQLILYGSRNNAKRNGQKLFCQLKTMKPHCQMDFLGNFVNSFEVLKYSENRL
jgi:hypothetical protein